MYDDLEADLLYLKIIKNSFKQVKESFVPDRGGRRKSRKKRGKGAMMSRRKKHMSAREPKEKYADAALRQLIQNPEWIRAGVVAQIKMMRDLAFELEDTDEQKKEEEGRENHVRGRRKRKQEKSVEDNCIF